MNAKDVILTDFIGKKDEFFFIPAYQRKYKWEYKKEIKELLEDLNEFGNDKEREYFFLGSIVVKKDANLNSQFILVDGQQRITTLLLILTAMKKILKEEEDHQTLFFKIKGLLDTNEGKFKLNRIKDQEIINKILNDEIYSIPPLEEKNNYLLIFNKLLEYFEKKKEKKENFLDIFFNEYIDKIQVAIINLEQKEDEFLIFESINSKGKGLSSSDLIKNYCLMNFDENLHREYENEIIDFLEKNKQIDDFNRQILAVKTGDLVSKSNKGMYFKFKNTFKPIDINTDLLKTFKKHLKIWNYIHNDKNFSYKHLPFIKASLMNFYSILHSIIYKNSSLENDKLEIYLKDKELEKIVSQISEIAIKRAMNGFGRVESNRTFAKIANEIYKSNGTIQDFENLFINKLKKSNGNNKIPSWNNIEKNINNVNLYPQHKNLLKWTLIACEQILAKKDLENKNKLTVEHIFPTNPSNNWSENKTKEMKPYLNILGNLSITKDNSALGNKNFKDKKKILEERSYLKINKFIFEEKEWNIDSIKKRTKKIFEMIKNNWNETDDLN